MANIVEEVKLIMSEVVTNNNKYWTGRLFDNDDVETEWGRVNITKDSKLFPSAGKRFLDKKKAEKLKKGYSELKVVATSASASPTVVQSSALHDIAKNQIKTAKPKPELEKLIKRLVEANVHKITASTQIAYNDATGLFSTPLGIITGDAIKDARDLLVDLHKFVGKGEYKDKTFLKGVSSYLRLVPQDLGMKIDVKKIFPDVQAIQKQSDLLDMLESSLNTYSTQPKKDVKGAPVTEEKVFEVELDLVEDQKEIDRINRFYRSTANGSHVSFKLKIVRVYKLKLVQMAEAFEKKGRAIGNVQELWHGTKKANVLSILKSGLRCSPPNTAAIAGKMFGNGIYFSDQSTKSLNYAYGYWDGRYEKDCFMLLNEVAMGKSYTPSGPSHNLPMSGYDSTFAVGGRSGVSNNEMIVYKDYQVNICYLVEFSE